MTKELISSTANPDLLKDISHVLDEYSVEEVQSIINELVHNSKWLTRHRERHQILDHLSGPFGRPL